MSRASKPGSTQGVLSLWVLSGITTAARSVGCLATVAAPLGQRAQITRTAEANPKANVRLRRPRAEAPASTNEATVKTTKIPKRVSGIEFPS